jgi:hypothetical protein
MGNKLPDRATAQAFSSTEKMLFVIENLTKENDRRVRMHQDI